MDPWGETEWLPDFDGLCDYASSEEEDEENEADNNGKKAWDKEFESASAPKYKIAQMPDNGWEDRDRDRHFIGFTTPQSRKIRRDILLRTPGRNNNEIMDNSCIRTPRGIWILNPRTPGTTPYPGFSHLAVPPSPSPSRSHHPAFSPCPRFTPRPPKSTVKIRPHPK